MNFDQFFEISSAGNATDAWGAPTTGYSVTGKLYGHVVTEKGREFVSAGSTDTMQRPISVITHYRDDITTKDRLIWQGDVYDIVGLVPNERRNELQINAVWTEGRS